MNKITEKLKKLILEPKKDKLISDLESVVLGKEERYVPEVQNPQYFEIWFYWAFDFQYIIIGRENYVIDASVKKDEIIINHLFEEFKAGFESLEEAEDEYLKLKQELEFNFFSDCWEELERKTKKNVRCFLIEHGIIRGFDVNKREKVEGEKIGEILDKEGIENHY